MALTPQQIEGLNAAYSRQQSGTANDTDLANLKYATGMGYKPPQTTQPVAQPVAQPAPVAQPVESKPPSTEVSPGIFSSSAMMKFYNDRLDLMKPQVNTATETLNNLNQTLSTLQKPDYQKTYDTQYASTVAPIDQNITATTQKLTTLDDNLRKLEDDVRGEIGGRAPESVIQAEVARRSKPLLMERQTYADQLTNYQSQKQNLTGQIEKQLGYQQQSYQDQLSLLSKQRDFAKSTIDEYNTLVEKGALATDKEVDNFRQMFNTLLTNSPDVLKNATAEEMNQLRSGFVPQSLMEKIGETIKEQQIKTQAQNKQGKIFGSASSGYYTIGEDGQAVQLVSPTAGIMTGPQRMDAAIKLMTANPLIQNLDEALRQIDMLSGGYVGSQEGPVPENVDYSNLSIPATKLMKDMTNEELSAIQSAMQSREGYFPGSLAYVNNNPGNIKFGDFARSLGAVDSGRKAQDGGTFAKFPSYEAGKAAQMALLKSGGYANLSFDSAMKRWSNNGYGANVIGTKQAPKTGALSGSSATAKGQTIQDEIAKLLTPPARVNRKDAKYLDAATTQSKAFSAEQKVKDYNEITSSYGRIASAQDNAAGDLSLIFAYMKMLDPGSVVREGEFATAQNSAGIPEQIRNAYNKALDGERLSANQRNQFKNQAKSIIDQSKKQYLGIVKFYADRARSAGLDPKDVIATFDYAPTQSSAYSSNGYVSGSNQGSDINALRTKYAY